MQNGRNRIAAHGRTKAGQPPQTGKRTRSPGKAATSAPPVTLPRSAPPAFPASVKVALPLGQNVPAATTRAKTTRKRKPAPATLQRRRPGRKKREAAREAASRQHTALIIATPRRRAPRPTCHPQTPEVIHLADAIGTAARALAIPLPPEPEPLVVTAAAASAPLADLPRQAALARPAKGLVAAIADWLRSARRLVHFRLLPRKARIPLPKPPRHLPLVSEAEQRQRVLDSRRQRTAASEALDALQAARSRLET